MHVSVDPAGTKKKKKAVCLALSLGGTAVVNKVMSRQNQMGSALSSVQTEWKLPNTADKMPLLL